MISQETARQIFNCHAEIQRAKEMLVEISKINTEEAIKARQQNFLDRHTPPTLEVSMPTNLFGNSPSYRIYQVRIDLGVSVIEAHIKDQEQKLKELEIQANTELQTPTLA
jgi:hypothetical protein